MTDTPDSVPLPSAETPPPTTTTSPAPPSRRHGARHVVAIVLGTLALLPGLGLLTGGTAIAVAKATKGDGYFTFTPDRVASDGVAVITGDTWLDDDDDGPWVLDWLDVDVRLRADGAGPTDDVFVGIARTPDVQAYLEGAAHSVIDKVDDHAVGYRDQTGEGTVAAPNDVDIWDASATGTGEQEFVWEGRGGRWSVVVMNADGTPGVAADVEVGARSDAVTPIAVTLIVLGGITILIGAGLIVFGVRGRRTAA